MTKGDVEMKQDEFNAGLGVLRDYTPRDQKYIKAKNKLFDNAKKFYEATENSF